MAFQFLCPQGHLLQGDESQAGQQCKCPYCETVFVVPQPVGTAGPGPSAAMQPDTVRPGTVQPDTVQPGAGFTQTGYEQPAGEQFPGIQTAPDFGPAAGRTEPPPQFNVPSAAQQQTLHILCPSGHELETPREMLGQDAMCPFCQVQFRLRLEDSVEYRKEQEENQTRREMQLGQSWMYWSIGAAVAVVLGVIVLICIAAG